MDVMVLRNETDMSSNDLHKTTVAKSVAMSVLFLASFTLGTLPIKLSKWFKWENGGNKNVYVEVLLCMGGGILLSTTFLHLLPEVEDAVKHSGILKPLNLPVAQLLMCCGFFGMYFIEECLHIYMHKRQIRSQPSDPETVPEKGDDEKHHHSHDHDGHGHSHVVVNDDILNGLRGLLIILGLSIHELFEGLSVGLESSATNVWYMFGAVSAHKLVIAFCIGVELVTSNLKVSMIVLYVFIFAIVSPMGIGIGIGLSHGSKSLQTGPCIILQGLATGTLLYIVFFEILRSDRKGGLKKYFAVLVGFIIMCAISKI